METFVLKRTGQAPLKFAGDLLAESEGQRLGGKDRNRWHDLAVYSTRKGRLVAAVVYKTQWEGELDHFEAEVFGNLDGVVYFLRSYNPTEHLAGYPPGQDYQQKQSRLVQEMSSCYETQVGDILSELDYAEDADADVEPALDDEDEAVDADDEDADDEDDADEDKVVDEDEMFVELPSDPSTYTITCTNLIPKRPARPSVGHFAIDGWLLATIVPCRACGGKLLWAEAGYVPGYRICEGCGRFWLVSPSANHKANTVSVTVSIPDAGGQPLWSWDDRRNTNDDAYEQYRRRMSEFGGKPVEKATWAANQ